MCFGIFIFIRTVKRRYIDPTDRMINSPYIRNSENFRKRQFIFQLNFVTHQLDGFALRRIAARRLNEQAHQCSFFAANHFHGTPQSQALNVHERFFPLCYRQNFIPRLQPTATFRRTARRQLVDDAVAALLPQNRTDARQRIAQFDGKIFHGIRRQKVGMRVVKLRQAVAIQFLYVRRFQRLNGVIQIAVPLL